MKQSRARPSTTGCLPPSRLVRDARRPRFQRPLDRILAVRAGLEEGNHYKTDGRFARNKWQRLMRRYCRPPRIANVEELLDVIEERTAAETVIDLQCVLDAVGSRSFGPLLIIAGLVTLTPLVGDIPGVPPLMGLLVIIGAVQILCGRRHVWLPKLLTRRALSREKFDRMLAWLRKPASGLDSRIKTRFAFLAHGRSQRVIAVAAIAVAIVMPFMELVPFSVTLAGAALCAFGLSLITDDGLPALVALALTALIYGGVGWSVLA